MNEKTTLLNRILILFSLLLFLAGPSCTRKQEISTIDESKYSKQNHFWVNYLGDSIVTGTSIPSKGKLIDSDSILPPIEIPLKQKPKVIPAHPNVKDIKPYRITKISSTIPVINPKVDTFILPDSFYLKERIPSLTYPKPTKALPFDLSPNAREYIQVLSVKHGLSDYDVWSIEQDSRGNIWFGMGNGTISRYDGIQFNHFLPSSDLNGIVRDIVEDKDGNMWFIVQGGGLIRYDGQNFVQFTEKSGFRSNRGWSGFKDSKGNLWFGTQDGTLHYFDGLKFIHYQLIDKGRFKTITAIIEDQNGHIWISSRNGIFRYRLCKRG